MTQETLKASTDAELTQVIAWSQAELAARREQRKSDAIAKIRELAASVGVAVTVGGTRGRPAKSRPTPKSKTTP